MDIDIENIEDLKNNDSALENTPLPEKKVDEHGRAYACLLYTSDAADDLL